MKHFIILFITTIVLLGCKIELYTGLKEAEANEMIAVLMRYNIDAERVATGKNALVNIEVSEKDLGKAIEVLKDNGLPREKFTNPGEVFKNDGLISSPMQENARYVYALSQELSETISKLDGVLTARVHLVLFDPKQGKKASAGIMIRHAQGVDVEQHTPKIKMLVMNSVEGMNYENISVAFFSQKSNALPSSATPEQEDSVLSATKKMGARSSTSQEIKWPISSSKTIVLSLLILALLGAVIVMLKSPKRSKKLSATNASTGGDLNA